MKAVLCEESILRALVAAAMKTKKRRAWAGLYVSGQRSKQEREQKKKKQKRLKKEKVEYIN